MNLPCSDDLELAAMLIYQFYNDQGRDNSSEIENRCISAGSAEIWLRGKSAEQFYANHCAAHAATDKP